MLKNTILYSRLSNQIFLDVKEQNIILKLNYIID